MIKKIFTTSVVVSALGYFVDIYDLILFGIVRVPSLTQLGYGGDELIKNGIFLLNTQMAGMLLGGIIWGILGDKKGRVSVLFGSIFLYSIAKIANAFVNDITSYALCRLFAGIGLAGELGAAVTLISEVLPKEVRGYGTAVVASLGVSGAIAAAIVGDLFDWKTAYVIGGVLGLALLLMRIKMFESGIYESIKNSEISKGNFLKIFTNKNRFLRYLNCILIGLPIWFVVGVLVTFSPEFGKALGVSQPISAGKSIMFTYIGLIFGDFTSGFLSQYFKSRKKIIAVYIVFTFVFILVYLFSRNISIELFYTICVLLGLAIGYWAVFVTIAAENFGTNLRSTVTTTVPNFIRGSVVPITLLFAYLRGSMGMIYAALLVGVLTIIIAAISLYNLDETFGKDLNFIEDV
jgi:putative MFS transporter